MNTVEHPLHLLPASIKIRFTVQVAMTREEVLIFFQVSVNDYFDKSLRARELRHHHAEGMITDEEWVKSTLEAIGQHANQLIKETD